MSLFKKKENEFSTGKKRPKLKPIGGAQEKAGTSGKGGGEPAKPTYDVNSDGWAKQLASFKAEGGRNNDGAFGYGYVDENTGIEVPWYIDMINGGGANAAGDTFVSPFAELPLGGGMLSMPTRLANAANIAPYGSNQPRYFMPMEAARVDAEGKPVQTDLGPASLAQGGGNVGGGSSAPTPTFVSAPTTDVSIGQGNTTPLSYGDQRPPEAIGINEILLNRNRGFHPTISPLTMPAASVPSPNYASYEGNAVPQIETPSMFSTGHNYDFAPDIDPSMLGIDRRTSTDLNQMRLDLLGTVPKGDRGTELDEQYGRYLRAGGTMNFQQFKKKWAAK